MDRYAGEPIDLTGGSSRGPSPMARACVTALAALVLSCVIAAAAPAASVHAGSGATAAAIPPRVPCQALAGVDLSRLDAIAALATTVVRDGHEFCQVDGYISPQEQFQMLLPTQTWGGTYLQEGCAAFCGSVNLNLRDPAGVSQSQLPWAPLANGEVAVATGNQGHFGLHFGDALWGKEDPVLRVVWGYTSEHSLARAAKALIRAYYGRRPSHSYFDGVSDGGRKGLIFAQRYPNQFDGILAGAPSVTWSVLVGQYVAWQGRANMDADGQAILTPEKLRMLHQVVLDRCGDGIVIRDPRACTFDPASIRCPSGDQADCLTAAQVRAARRLYRGPTYKGVNLFNGGQPYGSELGWVLASQCLLAINYVKYMAFWRNPADDYTCADIPFTPAMHRRLQRLGRLYNAGDPDLRAFRASGGKIIMYHGWADEGISPISTVDYYRHVVRRMGGYARSQRFSRLYMVPGLYHGPGGRPVGGNVTGVPLMEHLARWVEGGGAPGEVSFPVTTPTGAPLPTVTARPFNPLARAPRNEGLNSNYRYIGRRSAYKSDNELWCTRRGPSIACSGKRPKGS